MKTEMSKFATQRPTAVIAIDFGNPKVVVFIGSTSFDHAIDVIADDARTLYFVVASKPYCEKCIGAVGDSFFTVFRHCLRMSIFFEHWTVCYDALLSCTG